ncbi:PadR family transcriptional regulator [Catenuloplanes japonicus]|uniref:PadR family transcriptional regulator n=1 Tax=Catenuloplanes japonicus TaxID=33876 RepID=UPI000AACCC12|nr:helix-turn-helix transcriptional regulator [Catenuloplanes japonicus]
MPTAAVLRHMLQSPTDSCYGLALAEATGFPSGTIYPVLARLEAAGWVTSFWEREEPAVLERPRRRMYQLTGVGAHAARTALATTYQALGLPAFGFPQAPSPQVGPS